MSRVHSHCFASSGYFFLWLLSLCLWQYGFGLEMGLQESITTITVYTFWVFGILIALHTLGLSTTSLVVAFGALGIGLGFGLQNIFNNFISSIILLFERPIQVGDAVEINGIWANVGKSMSGPPSFKPGTMPL